MNFYTLQQHLVAMIGAAYPEDLHEADRSQVKSVINQMYRHCYLPTDGLRPPWAKVPFQLNTRAPFTATIHLVEGMTDFAILNTQVEFKNAFVGSSMVYGRRVSRIASVVPGDSRGYLATPSGVTGDFSVTVYSQSMVLPERTVDVDAEVYLGGGIHVAPLGSHILLQPRHHMNPGEYYEFGEVGDPCQYSVDTVALGGDMSPRLVVYPWPTREYAINGNANVAPKLLVDDDDIPLLPGDCVTDCLLPMARAKYAEVSPRYNAGNLNLLKLDRDEATKRIRQLASVQKGSSRRLRLKLGF